MKEGKQVYYAEVSNNGTSPETTFRNKVFFLANSENEICEKAETWLKDDECSCSFHQSQILPVLDAWADNTDDRLQ